MKKISGAMRAYWNSLDKWLLVFWLGASIASIPFLWAIGHFWPEDYSTRTQFVSLVIGLVLAFVISLFDYHMLLKLWRIYVPILVLLMLYTLFRGIGVGDSNRNWIKLALGGFTFTLQPSEFLKIAFITTLAMHLAKTKEHLSSIGNILLLGVHGAIYFALMYQDNGSMLVFISVFIIMLFCAGVKWRYFAIGGAAVAAAIPIIWRMMSEDQRVRILVVNQPELDPAGAYQQLWGLFALSIGGRQGTGLMAPKNFKIFAVENDMIFTFIGQTTGFIGCLGVIFLLTAIALKVIYNSTRAQDDEGRFLCIGIFAMIVSQTFINLGMCLRITPVIGITLPLFSSGGSSVLSLYICLGLLLSVYRNSSTGLFTKKSA